MSDEELEPFVDAFEHGERAASKKAYLKIKADNSRQIPMVMPSPAIPDKGRLLTA